MDAVAELVVRDSDPDGIVTATVRNWTGVMISFPVAELSNARKLLSSTGVYLLLGTSEDGEDLPVTYIGEAEAVDSRLVDSHSQLTRPDVNWHRVLVVMSQTEELNKAHVRWLEAELLRLAREAKRVKLTNGTDPKAPSLRTTELVFLEGFLEMMLMLFPLVQVDAFRAHGASKSASTRPRSVGDEDLIFHMSDHGKEIARATLLADNGMTVLKGARVSKTAAPYLAAGALRVRKAMLDNGLLEDEGNDHWVLAQDYDFTSPSVAADALRGGSFSGPQVWRLAGGQTLKEYKDSQG